LPHISTTTETDANVGAIAASVIAGAPRAIQPLSTLSAPAAAPSDREGAWRCDLLAA
jgi:hypothetical protein